jgi:hypothetical protein
MGQRLSKCGGRKRCQFLAEWKAAVSVWELKLDLVNVNNTKVNAGLRYHNNAYLQVILPASVATFFSWIQRK